VGVVVSVGVEVAVMWADLAMLASRRSSASAAIFLDWSAVAGMDDKALVCSAVVDAGFDVVLVTRGAL